MRPALYLACAGAAVVAVHFKGPDSYPVASAEALQARRAKSTTARGAAGDAAPASADDNFLYLDNGLVRVGVDLSRGGSIGYLAWSADPAKNIINIHDQGREVQGSFYSGPPNFDPPQCSSPSWPSWPWNPISSGDYLLHPSTVLNATQTSPTSATVVTLPLQWACTDLACECTFTMDVALVGSAVEVTLTLANGRSDKTFYGAYDQELPATYVTGEFCTSIVYTGDAPYTGAQPSTIVPSWPWTAYRSAEHWAAFVNASGLGMGVWAPGVVEMLTGQFRDDAPNPVCVGGPSDDATGYIAPVGHDILDWNIDYSYQFALVLGRVPDFQAYATRRRGETTSGPNWVFDSSRRGIGYANANDTGYPIAGRLVIMLDKAGSQIYSPLTFWSAEDSPTIYFTATYPDDLPPAAATAFVAWQRWNESSFDPANHVAVPLTVGAKTAFAAQLAGAPGYSGAMSRLAIQLASAPVPGASVQLFCIADKAGAC